MKLVLAEEIVKGISFVSSGSVWKSVLCWILVFLLPTYDATMLFYYVGTPRSMCSSWLDETPTSRITRCTQDTATIGSLTWWV